MARIVVDTDVASIAACCIAGGLPLVTRNTKDFVDFAEHDGLALVGD